MSREEPKPLTNEILRNMMEADSLRHKQSIQLIQESSDRIFQGIDALTIQVVQMNAGVKQNSQNIDKLNQSIGELRGAINGHLQVAQQQAQNITQLIETVNALVIRN